MATAVSASNDRRTMHQRRRMLLIVAAVSSIGCGLIDWVAEPHDVVVTKFEPRNGELVETASSTRPNTLTNRLLLTALNGILGGALTAFVAWLILHLRDRMRNAQARRTPIATGRPLEGSTVADGTSPDLDIRRTLKAAEP